MAWHDWPDPPDPVETHAFGDPALRPTPTRTFRLRPRPVFRLRPFAGPADGRLDARLETYERLAVDAGPRFRSLAVLCEPPGLCSTVTT